jgi:CHAT domain-containing protein
VRLVPTLHVERLGERVRFRLEIPEQDIDEPLQQEFTQRLDDSTIASLRQSAATLLAMAESPAFEGEALARGQLLYRTLIPVALRDPLKRISGPLLVSTSLHGLPFELLHDGNDWWGLRYALGKRLVTERSGATARPLPLPRRPRALVIGSDPRGDLPFVRHEIEAIGETLAEFADVHLVSGRLATFDAVTSSLREGFDLIHFCGHVGRETEGGSALLLAEGEQLAATVIEANLQGRPLVFLNGCASTRGASVAIDADWEEDLSSVASGFLFGGAVGVVGTLCEVGDPVAADLAREFYARILQPVPVGEALRLARARLRASRPGSPVWLAFVLYGNPGQVVASSSKPVAADLVEEGDDSALVRTLPTWRRRALLAAGTLLAALLGLALFRRFGVPGASRSIGESPPVVVGVMEIRDLHGNAPRWMLEVTRDGLNTILSKVEGIRVYSKQKIDFLRLKRGLSEIEVADTLGMSKMVSATLAVAETTVRIDVEIVDIASGLLEAAESARGSADELVDLQNQIAVKTVHALGVAPTTAQLDQILANRTNETLDAYRLLVETLPAQPAERKDAPRSPGGADSDNSWLDLPSSAFAQEVGAEEAAIRRLLEDYRGALEAKSVERLAEMQVEMQEVQRDALRRYFQNVRDLTVRIVDVELLVAGDEALATFTREDAFTDAPSGRPMHLEVRTEQKLVKVDGSWKILGAPEPE